jgi:hypothetical protein
MADGNSSGGGGQQGAAPARSTVTIAGLSMASLTRLAENNADKVLQAWKDIENGKEMDHNDTAVQLALEWLESTSRSAAHTTRRR